MNSKNLRLFDILEGKVCVTDGILNRPANKVKNKIFMITSMDRERVYLTRLDTPIQTNYVTTLGSIEVLPLTKNIALFMELRKQMLEGQNES